MNDDTHKFVKKPCENPDFKPDANRDETYCAHCDKTVRNLSRMTEEEANSWNAANPGACVTVRQKRGVDVFRPKMRPSTPLLALVVFIASVDGYAGIVQLMRPHGSYTSQLAGDIEELVPGPFDLVRSILLAPPIEERFLSGANEMVTAQVSF